MDEFGSQQNREDVCEMDEIIYDLCIIGEGFFGSAAVRHASSFPDIKLCFIGLDKSEESGVENQNIFPLHYDDGKIVKVLFPSPAYQKLSRSSLNGLRHLEEISGITFYNRANFLYIGEKGSHLMKELEDVSAVVKTSLITIFDSKLMNIKYPFFKLKDDEYALLDHTGAGVISAHKMLDAERKIAREQGCHILFDDVTDVQSLSDKYHTVETIKSGKIKAKRILFAADESAFVKKFSILPQIEICVRKELAIIIRIPHSEAERLSSMPAILHKKDADEVDFYALPPILYPDGKYYLKVGSMVHESGAGVKATQEFEDFCLSKDDKSLGKETMTKQLFEIIPELVTEEEYRKVCETSSTPTGFPYIERISPTVTLAVAGNGWAASIAEEIGRIAAILSLNGTWDSDIPKTLFDTVLSKHKE